MSRMKKTDTVKGSFNYRSSQLKENFKRKVALEGKTTTTVINDLIENYIQEISSFSRDEAVKNVIIKLLLLMNTDELNKTVIKKELERLWELIR